jgi:hypothetical protein
MTSEPMTLTWAEIGERFRRHASPAGAAIVGLCTFIDARPIRSGVHGWATIDALGITQLPLWNYDAPHLWLELNTDTVAFSYRDTNVRSRMWTRTEPPERVIERFRKTMIQLNWFTDRSVLS